MPEKNDTIQGFLDKYDGQWIAFIPFRTLINDAEYVVGYPLQGWDFNAVFAAPPRSVTLQNPPDYIPMLKIPIADIEYNPDSVVTFKILWEYAPYTFRSTPSSSFQITMHWDLYFQILKDRLQT
jgi:hypothetical protein